MCVHVCGQVKKLIRDMRPASNREAFFCPAGPGPGFGLQQQLQAQQQQQHPGGALLSAAAVAGCGPVAACAQLRELLLGGQPEPRQAFLGEGGVLVLLELLDAAQVPGDPDGPEVSRAPRGCTGGFRGDGL
jgi:hypothetical protein